MGTHLLWILLFYSKKEIAFSCVQIDEQGHFYDIARLLLVFWIFDQIF